MTTTRRYTVVLEPGEDGWIAVHCPALPGLWTQGRTREEALANAREALELFLEVLVEDGQPIPEDSDLELAQVSVRPSAPIARGLGRPVRPRRGTAGL